jgi:hypothetical protein
MLLNLVCKENQVSTSVGEILSYNTRNMFSGPLITPRGDLVGVVQLLNKLPLDGPFPPSGHDALPDFDERDERLFSIISGQAALAIENSLLLEEQETPDGRHRQCLRDGDRSARPGHVGSQPPRIEYTVGLAEAVNRTDTGPLRDVLFTPAQLRELRFASMLHDVGKIGVREEILQKRKKLCRMRSISLRCGSG